MFDSVHRHRATVSDVDHAVGTRHRDDGGCVQTHHQATARLDGRGILFVADEAVGQTVRRAVGSAAAADAEMRATEAAEILERAADPVIDDLDHVRTNRTRSPAITNAGFGRSTSNIATFVWPSRCHPPGLVVG